MTGSRPAEPTLDELLTSSADVVGGQRVFRGTRVPVEAVFGNLAAGLSLDEILTEFDTLDRGDVVRVIELTAKVLGRSRAA